MEWLPTPVFLPGKFHGQRILTGYSSWGHKALDMIERLTHTFIFCLINIGLYFKLNKANEGAKYIHMLFLSLLIKIINLNKSLLFPFFSLWYKLLIMVIMREYILQNLHNFCFRKEKQQFWSVKAVALVHIWEEPEEAFSGTTQ